MNRQEELEGLSDATLAELVARHIPQYPMTPEQFDKFNPCNNPNDIMPLVIENGISLKHLPCSNIWIARESRDISNNVYNSNPYRAACIILILIKETES